MHLINSIDPKSDSSVGTKFAHEMANTGSDDLTPVGRMFDGRSVFVTGASGFIGRVLLEKLLRSYQGIKNIYILMRTKKNQNPMERLHKQLLRAPIFDTIRAKPNGAQLLDKIVVIPGDIGEPNLGISEKDLDKMLADETLSIVFHSAATIKFDEPLKVSVRLNLIATKTIIGFCRNLPNLISVCHVSTAYANSDLTDNRPIEEKLYSIKDKPEDLIKMAEIMDENLMQTLKVPLVDRRPNTYTYTKALAEHLIVEEAADLPIAIVRPTIVVAAWRQPVPGWIDNLNGPTGLLLAIGKGLLRSLNCNHSVIADCVPVDVVVNTMIASAFYVAVTNNKLNPDGSLPAAPKVNGGPLKTINEEEFDLIKSSSPVAENGTNDASEQATDGLVKDSLTSDDKTSAISAEHDVNKQTTAAKEPPIVHCNTGQLKPITWGQMENLFWPTIRKYPSCQVLRYPFGSFKGNYYHDLITRIFVHYLPALMIDFLCVLLGKKRQLLSVYNKLHCATAALSHFTMHNYNFRSKNMKLIEKSLSDADRQDLYMDLENLDWLSFWDDYVHGAR